MDKLIFNAVAVLNEQALLRQRTVSELANVSTVGFKRSFDAALQSVKVDGGGFDTRHQARMRGGEGILLEPGPLMVTGRALDIAMEGSTVLGVRAANGELAFTRRGDLRVNVNGLLETGSGQIVLGQGGPINVPPGFDVRITPDGSVMARDPAQQAPIEEQAVGQLLLRDASTGQLARREDGLFRVAGQPPGSDLQPGPQLPAVTPQALEGSNVSAIEALTRLIDHSRAFEAQIRVVKEMKDLDSSGASMLRPS